MTLKTNPFDSGYYSSEELREMGFAKVGENVQIAKNCTIVGLHNISIGHHVRIDGLTAIIAATGHLMLGSYIHIAGGCHLACSGGIALADFSGLSQGVKLYSVSDDYSGSFLTNPTVPKEYLNVIAAPISLEKHVIVGSGSVVMPGVTIGEGSALGAFSLATKSLEPWGVYAGIPVKRMKDRAKTLLEYETKLLS